MKKALFKIAALCVLFSTLFVYSVIAQDEKDSTSEEVIAIVDMAVEAMKKDAPGTIEKINASADPFINKDNPALYVFVYDKEVNMIAHPNKGLVGKNFKGKPDVKGKKFRDEIVDGAIANGKGWVDYAYQKPGATGIFDKTAYYQMVTASDGKEYVVISGKYKDKK